MTSTEHKHPVTDFPMQQLKKCIEQALVSVAGVTQASMDLASGVISVVGTIQTDELILTLKRVGFPPLSPNSGVTNEH